MKNKNTFILISTFCVGVIFCFNTCKKYPEDKFYSLKTPEKRVFGLWNLLEYNFNGSSVVGELNAKLQRFDIRELSLRVVGQDGKKEGYCVFSPYFTSSFQSFAIEKSERSVFYFNHNFFSRADLGDSIKKVAFLSPLSFNGANFTKWDIRNLYKNKMHLQLKTDSGNYDIFFSKTSN